MDQLQLVIDLRLASAGQFMTDNSQAPVDQAIVALTMLDRTALLARWQEAFGNHPPPSLSRSFMVKALAYDLQCGVYGGLSARSERTLKVAARSSRRSAPPRALARGSRLIREWNGQLCEVEVVDQGYLWEGRTYRSLSAIARAITGARWSGPRFFGLEPTP